MTQGDISFSYGKNSPAELIEKFDRFLQAAYRALSTRAMYLSQITQFSKSLADLLHPKKNEVYDWFKQRRNCVSQNTLNISINSVRSFYEWADLLELLSNIAVFTWIPKTRTTQNRLPRYLTIFQVQQLLDAPNRETFVGFRDYVMMRLAYETGIRSAELHSLQIGSFLGDQEIYIESGKGGVDRIVPCSKEMERLKDEWLRIRATARPGKNNSLFITRFGRSFSSPKSFWKIVHRYSQSVFKHTVVSQTPYLTGKSWSGIYPHLLRSSCATHMLQHGCDIRGIQELLGHANIKTTALYVGVDLKTLRREHEKLFKRRTKSTNRG